MSSKIREVVQVSITKDTKGVSRLGFGVPLLITQENVAGWLPEERVRFYTDASQIVDDVTGGTDSRTYKALQTVFSQNPRVQRVAVGVYDVGQETITEAINAIEQYNPGFYGIALIERDASDAILLATWADANARIFSYATDDAEVVDTSLGTDTGSIAKTLKDAGRENVILSYHTKASTEFMDCAILGVLLPLDPGTYTLKFKTLIGITADNLTSTKSQNALEKDVNIYEEIGGRNIVREGTAPSGEFIDINIFLHWLTARIRESVYGVLVNAQKVPYTEQGILMIENALEVPLKVGLDRGAISPMLFDDDDVQIGGYVINSPDFANIPQSDKQDRVLKNVEFTAWLSGAIHKVEIQGVLTL